MFRKVLSIFLLSSFLILSAFSFCQGETLQAKPFLHPLFTDNMVLQRDKIDAVWGWTKPGAKITVSMDGQTAKAIAAADGKWLAKIGPFKAGGPYILTVTGPQKIKLANVLVGDVWVCSGQSNMEFGINLLANPQDEITKADHPRIRLFITPKKLYAFPQETFSNSGWQVCNPATIVNGGWNGFSAAAYFFARDLQDKIDVPIGLLESAWGSTPGEAWVSKEALQAIPDIHDNVTHFMKMAEEQQTVSFEKQVPLWYQQYDPGSDPEHFWAAPDFDAASWQTVTLPAQFIFDGIVWFRKEVTAPNEWAGKELILHFDVIDDRDTTYFNGVKIGGLDFWSAPRDYKIPGSLVKAGRNVIAIRCLNMSGPGGLHGKAENMKLELAQTQESAQPIALAGDWLTTNSTPLNDEMRDSLPADILGNNADVMSVKTVVYNGLIAPLFPFGIKGALWYQGEANFNAMQYREILPTLIKDWRNGFCQGDFPFLIVQLANYQALADQPAEQGGWAEIREAQMLTAQTVTNTGIVTAFDIGEANDIHPKNKQEIGRRLSLLALGKVYGQKVAYSGPVYKSMAVEEDKIRLTFDEVHGEMVIKSGDDKLKGFAIAGADKNWVWADAVIDGKTVLVSSPSVSSPVAVRYGWGMNVYVNLYNKAGLPAFPFRTDRP